MVSNKNRVYVALYARGGAPRMPGGEDTYVPQIGFSPTHSRDLLLTSCSYAIRYHWAILVGPKLEEDGSRGMRYHAKERMTQGGSQWQYEERDIPIAPTGMLLVRVMIGKVADQTRLVTQLRNTPVRQGQPGWNCVSWVQEALERLRADGKAMGTSVLDWRAVRDGAMTYCQQKKDAHRFDGQQTFDMTKVATYDLVERKETVP
jgi:hypothetical protein